MSQEYYVRIRGRVSGPFELTQLKGMVQRGRFSRAHEVSTDGVSWNSAADVATLFTGHAGVKKPAATGEGGNGAAKGQSSTEELSLEAPESASQSWYYSVLDQKRGPIALSELQTLARQNVITTDTLVWTQGMPEWKKAPTIPQLASFIHSAGTSPAPSMSAHQDEGHVKRELATASRTLGWLMFITSFGVVSGALLTLAGIWLTASGFEAGSSGSVLQRLTASQKISAGLTSVVLGATLVLGGHLFNNFRLSIAAYSRDGRQLANAFERFHSFIVYISILLIIYLVGLAFLSIQVIAVAGSLGN